ncbi:MAG: tRNA (adenosine(37)-N6)-dimethylallyltransferase MiaA [candidate division WOR-3 bacterium]
MKVLVLTGPTGVGKTEVAIELARRLGLELISADSRQVYAWLDIGTAKPGPELRSGVKFHMVDLVEPNRVYSAADYARDATAVMRRLVRERKKFMVVGGAGLYIRALFEPFFDVPRPNESLRRRLDACPTSDLYRRLQAQDPARAAQLHPNDRQRIMRAVEVIELTGRTMTELARTASRQSEFKPSYVVLTIERSLLYKRLDERFEAMMKAGFLDEVRRLREAGFGRDTYVANAYGYAELLAHLDGELTIAEAVNQAKAKTRAYARRQLTWCRSLPGAVWIEHTSVSATVDRVISMLGSCD